MNHSHTLMYRVAPLLYVLKTLLKYDMPPQWEWVHCSQDVYWYVQENWEKMKSPSEGQTNNSQLNIVVRCQVHLNEHGGIHCEWY